MFWDAPRPLAGAAYRRLRLLLSHDIAVYASHLPLDAHLSMGNAVLLARELGLVPSLPFAHFQGVPIGTAGESDLGTTELLERADRFAKSSGGAARATPSFPGRRSRRWAICTGSGASTDTLREAAQLRIDTLIVGEGPHHTVVDATDEDLVVIYAGHYATETLGVQAVAAHVSERFGVPWDFIFAPTGS
jgi:putative NIF3 family GTP cyclohydrolase 1 type 2